MRAQYCWLPRMVRGKASHEETGAREGHHVDCQLVEVSIELDGAVKAGGDTASGG